MLHTNTGADLMEKGLKEFLLSFLIILVISEQLV